MRNQVSLPISEQGKGLPFWAASVSDTTRVPLIFPVTVRLFDASAGQSVLPNAA